MQHPFKNVKKPWIGDNLLWDQTSNNRCSPKEEKQKSRTCSMFIGFATNRKFVSRGYPYLSAGNASGNSRNCYRKRGRLPAMYIFAFHGYFHRTNGCPLFETSFHREIKTNQRIEQPLDYQVRKHYYKHMPPRTLLHPQSHCSDRASDADPFCSIPGRSWLYNIRQNTILPLISLHCALSSVYGTLPLSVIMRIVNVARKNESFSSNYRQWQTVHAIPIGLGWGGSPAMPTGWHPEQLPAKGGCGESIAEGCLGAGWHTVQLTVDIGKWQLRQWRFLVFTPPHDALWLNGVVLSWHRTQKSSWWHILHFFRSHDAANPWVFLRQALLWFLGFWSWWQLIHQ